MPPNRLQLKTFAGLALTGGDLVPRGAAQQRKPLALLALLAVAGDRGMTREKIAGMLWSESDEERARANLKQTLYAIRKDSGQAELIVGTGTLRLNPEVLTADVTEFEALSASGRLAEAAARYAGPFLDGIYIEEAAEFERWSEEQRQRLAGLHRRNLTQLARQSEAAGDHHSAAAWLSALCREQPLDATTTLRLMLALEHGGDRVGAITAGERFCKATREELDAPVPSEIEAVLARLRAQPVTLPPLPNRAMQREQVTGDPSIVLPVSAMPTSATRSRRGVLLGAATLMVAAVLAITAGRRWGSTPPAVDASLQPRETRPLVLVRPFQLRAGPDTLGFLGSILADRIARSLSSGGIARIVGSDSAPGANRPVPDPDLTISGFYYTVGDTLVVEADLLGRSTLLRLQSLPTTRGMLAGVDQAATTLTDAALNAVKQVFDSTKIEWGIAPDRTINPKAYSWFLMGSRHGRFQLGCEEARADLDSALAADSAFSLPLIYGLSCAGSGQGPDFIADSSAIAGINARIAPRRAVLSPFESDLANYLSLAPFFDADAVLNAARRLRAEAPESRQTGVWLIQALIRANRFDEAIALTLAEDSVRARRYGASHGSGASPFFAELLHLSGRYAQELREVRKGIQTSNPAMRTWFAHQELRALAAVGDSAGVAQAIARTLQHRSFSEEGIWPKFLDAEELAAHGFQRLADSLTKGLDEQSCLHLGVQDQANTLRDLAIQDIRSAKDSLRLRQAEEIQLWSARDHLRYGCNDDASSDLARFRTPILDSLSDQVVNGELLARKGRRIEAEAVAAWLLQHDPLSEHRGTVPPWSAVYARARIAAILGNRAEAFTLLSSAIVRGMPYDLKVHSDPLWRGFAEDPVFRTAVNR